MPAAVVVAIVAMAEGGAVYIVRFIGLCVSFVARSEAKAILPITPFAVGVLAVFGVVIFLLVRGTRWVPIAVTVLAIWIGSTAFTNGDVLAWVSAGVMVAGIVAAWLPSARSFARSRAIERGAASASS